jgi:hypothetical protein
MSQKDRVLQYLKQGKVLTRLNAWDELGVIETPARISELRHEGHEIQTAMKPVINRYGESVRIAEWFMQREQA